MKILDKYPGLKKGEHLEFICPSCKGELKADARFSVSGYAENLVEVLFHYGRQVKCTACGWRLGWRGESGGARYESEDEGLRRTRRTIDVVQLPAARKQDGTIIEGDENYAGERAYNDLLAQPDMAGLAKFIIGIGENNGQAKEERTDE